MSALRFQYVSAGFFVVGAACTALFAFAGPAPQFFVYDRGAVAEGELWRLITGHLAHADTTHLVLNLLGLCAIAAILKEALNGWGGGLLLVACAAAIDAWLWYLEPQLQQYCGLSGILYGMAAAGLLLAYEEGGHRHIILAVVLVAAAKLVAEASYGWALSDHADWPVLPGAHVAGVGGGALFAILKRGLQKAHAAETTVLAGPRR